MSTVLYILLAIIVLLALITVHEFGHYCAGKILGFKINEFSIGFGPAIFKRTNKKTGELFAVRVFPLGGYCAFEGEDDTGEGDTSDKGTNELDAEKQSGDSETGKTDGKAAEEADIKLTKSEKTEETASVEAPAPKKRDYKTFNEMPAWKRLVVLLSGVSFNFLFGVLTAVLFLFVNGYAVPKISATVFNKTAESYNLQPNDIILKVEGKSIEEYRTFEDLISKYGDNTDITVTVDRNGEIIDVIATRKDYGRYYYVSDFSKFKGKIFHEDGSEITESEFVNEVIAQEVDEETVTTDTEGKGQELIAYFSTVYKTDLSDANRTTYTAQDIEEFLKVNSDGYATIGYVKNATNYGIVFSKVGMKYSFGECIYKAWPFCGYLCNLIFKSIGGLFTGATKVSEIGGTVTAISQIAEYSSWGLSYFLLLLPLLSMNLALFNILPIPALDGAKAVFILIEMIFRKPVNRKVEAWIHTIGLFVLLGLVVFLDIYHFAFAGHFILRL